MNHSLLSIKNSIKNSIDNFALPVTQNRTVLKMEVDKKDVIFIVLLVIMYTEILFGIYGNIRLVTIFAKFDGGKKMSNFSGLTIALAIFDTLLIIFVGILGPYYHFGSDRFEYKKIFIPIAFIAAFGSGLSTITISLERYFKVHRYKYVNVQLQNVNMSNTLMAKGSNSVLAW